MIISLSLSFILFIAAPAAAQMWFLADHALPSPGEPWAAGVYGRGSETNAAGVVLGRQIGRAALMGGYGYVGGHDANHTVGVVVGADLFAGEQLRLSVQGGIGWMNYDFSSLFEGDILLDVKVTALRFPIGLALKTRLERESLTVTPWAMPMLHVTRTQVSYDDLSDSDNKTELDFGTSAGAYITSASGFGVHAALGVIFSDEDEIRFTDRSREPAGNAAWLSGATSRWAGRTAELSPWPSTAATREGCRSRCETRRRCADEELGNIQEHRRRASDFY